MVVTLPTSHEEMSRLKAEAEENTRRRRRGGDQCERGEEERHE